MDILFRFLDVFFYYDKYGLFIVFLFLLAGLFYGAVPGLLITSNNSGDISFIPNSGLN